MIDGELPVLNFDWYNNTLWDLPGFTGFTPRTIWPASVFTNPDDTSLEVTNILLVVDCLQEQKIGLAPDFNPYILGDSEVMMGQTAAEFLQLEIGDTIDMELNLDLTNNDARSGKLKNLDKRTPL